MIEIFGGFPQKTHTPLANSAGFSLISHSFCFGLEIAIEGWIASTVHAIPGG